jgi:hypothetical protein
MFRASLRPAIHPIASKAPYPDWRIAACVAAVAELAYDEAISNRGPAPPPAGRVSGDARCDGRYRSWRRSWQQAAALSRLAPRPRFAALRAVDADPVGLLRAKTSVELTLGPPLASALAEPGSGGQRRRGVLSGVVHRQPAEGLG